MRTDADGRIAEPNYFAVIRIDSQQPSTPVVPVPTPPQPSATSPPRLLKQELTPPGVTLYVEIDLKIVDKAGIRAPSVTGIFIPDGYQQGATVDVVLYLHGFKAEAIKREAIDQYWNSQRFPYGALREGVNASARNVVLVAPTLGSRSEAGSLLKPGGLDAYIVQVLAALRAHGVRKVVLVRAQARKSHFCLPQRRRLADEANSRRLGPSPSPGSRVLGVRLHLQRR